MHRLVLAAALTACDPAPEPPAPPTEPTAPDGVVDCAHPPPVPRCPAESSPSCAALWDKVAAWKAACPEATLAPSGE